MSIEYNRLASGLVAQPPVSGNMGAAALHDCPGSQGRIDPSPRLGLARGVGVDMTSLTKTGMIVGTPGYMAE